VSDNKNLKPGWKTWRFEQIAQPITERAEPTPEDSALYVGLEHMDTGSLRIRRWGSQADLIGTKFRMRRGDILFARRNAYLKRVAIAPHDGLFSAHGMVLRAKPEVVLPEFLPFFMQSDLFMNRAVEISVGSLSPTINWKTLAAQDFALPPMDEQMRAVELLGAVDEQVASLENAIDTLSQVKAAFVEKFLSASSESCPTISLAEGCLRVTDGTHQPPTFTDQGIPFFLVKTISSGFVDWASTKFVSKETYDELTRRVRPKRGDVLYTAVGATYGVALLVDFDEAFVFQRHIAHIIPNPEKLIGRYVEEFLNSRAGKRQSDRSAIGSAQPTVTLKSLSNFKVPLPTIVEQKAFVAELESVTAALGDLEGRLQSTAAIRTRALNGVLL